MSATLLREAGGTASAVTAAATCHHCGEPLPTQPAVHRVDGVEQRFCCDGCAAAAQWIDEAGLDDYYRLRSEHAGRVGTEAVDLSVWDRSEVQAEHVRDIPGGREVTLLTDGMRCAACAWLIDRALVREPGVIEASANAVTGRIRLAWDPEKTILSRPLQRLLALGYKPYLAGGEEREKARRAERNRDLIRIGIAGLASMQAMMVAEALYLDFNNTMSIPARDFLRWITFLLSTPVVFYSGWPFLSGAWRELRNRQLGMDTLIASSTLLAYLASVVATVQGHDHVWYDAAVMFVFLLLAARMLEKRARAVASAQVDALARARPAFATRELPDGTRESVPLAALEVGDIACVAVGEVVPADGRLLEPARLEEALLTGEPAPVEHVAGDIAYAGTVCRERPTRLEVLAIGAGTRLAELSHLVEQAQSQRPELARSAGRIAHHFVAGLIVATLLVYFGWRIYDPSRAFEVTLALLVISCPCALSLAVPSALTSAHGALARLGVLAVRENALETLAGVTDIVFDKTGTLSDGHPELAAIEVLDPAHDREGVLRIAAALERDSGHPIARAFAGVDAVPVASGVQAVPGQGIGGEVDGTAWRLGRAAYATGGREPDDDHVWLGDGTRAVARFRLSEAERPDAAAAVEALRGLGVRVHLASGDAAAPVERFAARVGIADPRSRQTPEDKLAFARALQAEGRVVAMVGDGLNDAPVLAGADVSLAVGEGAALAQRAADLVLTGPTLLRIPQAIEVARKGQRVIRQNLAWATGYNVLAIPLAAAGLVTPWLAALGMALSSLVVTVNALRLSRRGDRRRDSSQPLEAPA